MLLVPHTISIHTATQDTSMQGTRSIFAYRVTQSTCASHIKWTDTTTCAPRNQCTAAEVSLLIWHMFLMLYHLQTELNRKCPQAWCTLHSACPWVCCSTVVGSWTSGPCMGVRIMYGQYLCIVSTSLASALASRLCLKLCVQWCESVGLLHNPGMPSTARLHATTAPIGGGSCARHADGAIGMLFSASSDSAGAGPSPEGMR